jgi:hypothetical protein
MYAVTARHTSPESLNIFASMWYNAVIQHETSAKQGDCWIDVCDFAEKHVKALQSESAGGERVVNTAGTFCFTMHCFFNGRGFDATGL